MKFPQPGQNGGVRRSRVYREQQALHLLAQASVRFCGHALESCRALVQQHELAPTCMYFCAGPCACTIHHMCLLYLGKHTQCTSVPFWYLSLSDLMAFKVVSQCSKQFCLSHVGFWKGGCCNPLSLGWLRAVHALVRAGSVVVTWLQKETFLCNWLLFKIPDC